MLSAEQRSEFEARGLLRFPGLVDAKVVSDLRERVLERLRGRRLVPDPVPPGFAVNPSKLAALTNKLAFDALWGPRTSELADDLLGAGRWHRPEDAGQILALTWPDENATWSVPKQSWHLDYMAPAAAERMPGLQLFVCVDRVERHGGGTVVACGTHRRIDALRKREAPDWKGRSADVRARLKDTPWQQDVAELAGEPGDVFAMHPWLLHALARNCGTRPRMVVTQRLYASGV